MEPGATIELPPAVGEDTVRVLYVFEGSVTVDGEAAGKDLGVVVEPTAPVPLQSGPDGVEILVLQARPIGEPVAQYGPFVMNTQQEIEQAFSDYRATGFGGWPWDRTDPVHGGDAARFARHASGRMERPDLDPAQADGAAAAKSS
jgi:hypothetical protein